MSRVAIPLEAVDWLSVWRGVRGLVLAGDTAWPKRLHRAGHTLFALTDQPAVVDKLGPIDRITPAARSTRGDPDRPVPVRGCLRPPEAAHLRPG